MTPRQCRFVDEYLIDLNATQAAIRAGYAESGARTEGTRLLANADIWEAIELAQAERGVRVHVDQDWVLRNLTTIARRCLQASPVLDRKGKPITVENEDGELVPAFTFDAAGANRATELVGKHLGMFVERHEHSGEVRNRVISGEPLSPEQWSAKYEAPEPDPKDARH